MTFSSPMRSSATWTETGCCRSSAEKHLDSLSRVRLVTRLITDGSPKTFTSLRRAQRRREIRNLSCSRPGWELAMGGSTNNSSSPCRTHLISTSEPTHFRSARQSTTREPLRKITLVCFSARTCDAVHITGSEALGRGDSIGDHVIRDKSCDPIALAHSSTWDRSAINVTWASECSLMTASRNPELTETCDWPVQIGSTST